MITMRHIDKTCIEGYNDSAFSIDLRIQCVSTVPVICVRVITKPVEAITVKVKIKKEDLVRRKSTRMN